MRIDYNTGTAERKQCAADYIISDREKMNGFISSCTFFCFSTFLTFFEKKSFSSNVFTSTLRATEHDPTSANAFGK